MSKGKKRLSWIIRTVLIANLILLAMAGWGIWRFGSIPHALGYMRGERLFAMRSSVEMGRIDAGEHRTVEYMIRNMSDQPVKILGAKSSCTCAHVVDVPMEIAPGDTRALKFDVHPSSKQSSVDGIFLAFTNHPRQPILTLKLSGTVRNPVASQGQGTSAEE